MENVGKAERFAKHFERMFGVRVKDLRQAKGLTQEELAARMTASGYPMHQTTVAKMEGGGRPTSVGEMAVLAAIFEMAIPDLFQDTDDARDRMELAAAERMIDAIQLDIDKLDERRAGLVAQLHAAQQLYKSLAAKLAKRIRTDQKGK